MPYFSIVVITYNRADLLPRCIDSVINQTFKDWELIIVDNYSEDESKTLVESYMKKDSRILFKQVHNNNVLAVSRNEGIRMARGTYICTLDSDDWFTNNKLQVAYDECNKEPYDVLYSKFQLMTSDGPGKVYGKSLTWANPFLELLINSNTICNTTTIIKKEAWEDVGLLSENPELSAVEDIDGLLKLASTGHSFHFIDEMLGYYWIGNNMSYSPKQVTRVNTLYEKWLPMVDVNKREMAVGSKDYLCARIYHKIEDYKNAQLYYIKVLKNKKAQKKCFAIALYISSLLKIKI